MDRSWMGKERTSPEYKKSIFFDLPYWEYNLIRHNLDVMHIEKNVCDNLLGTLLNLEGKTKDHLKARLDLQEMGIRSELHPEDRGSGKTYIPPACFTMSRKEKQEFLQCLKDIKVPYGYASNISRCVHPDQLKIFGLKSHDGHILMQQLLGLAVRGLLPEHVAKVVIEFCNIFRELFSKVLYMDDLEKLESRVVVILCRMQKIFPPSFFTIMVHLVVHLVSEAKIAGPVFFRWMYPVDRYFSTLKDYVGNRAYPEGSIAEGYLAQECLRGRPGISIINREEEARKDEEIQHLKSQLAAQADKTQAMAAELASMKSMIENMATRNHRGAISEEPIEVNNTHFGGRTNMPKNKRSRLAKS